MAGSTERAFGNPAGEDGEDRGGDRSLFLQPVEPRTDDHAASLTPGTRIDDFEVVGLIAAGGMGEVYEAVQNETGLRVALKIVRPEFAGGATARRLRHEAALLAQLDHPGIAQVLGAGLAPLDGGPDRPYFVMQLVRGEPLDRHIERRGLERREILDLARRVCEAAGAAHARGIVHRDLKPSNILVDQHGQPRIVDFGIARVLRSDIARTTMHTESGQLLGTLRYMSPEQTGRDPDAIGPATDVYALGVILHKLLAGEMPYEVNQGSLYESIRAIRDDEPSRLRTFDRSLRGDVETIVLTALAKEPPRRFANASEMAEQIGRHLRSQPLTIRPPGTLYQLGKFARRNKPLVAGVAAAFLALLAGTIASAVLAVRATSAEQTAQRRFDQVRGIATSMMFDVHDAVAEVPGSLEARRLIVEEALEYLEALSADARDEPALVKEVARGFIRVADMLEERQGPGFHDFQSANGQYQRAVDLLAPLAEAGDHDALKMTAKALTRMIYPQGTADASGPADPRRRHAVELLDRVFDESPQDIEARMLRVDALSRRASRVYNLRSVEAAKPVLEQAIAGAESLLASAPDNEDARFVAARAHYYRAAVLIAAGSEPEHALASANRIEEILGSATRNEAQAKDLNMLTGASLVKAGALKQLERYDDAQAAAEQANALAGVMAERDPDDATATRQMMVGAARTPPRRPGPRRSAVAARAAHALARGAGGVPDPPRTRSGA